MNLKQNVDGDRTKIETQLGEEPSPHTRSHTTPEEKVLGVFVSVTAQGAEVRREQEVRVELLNAVCSVNSLVGHQPSEELDLAGHCRFPGRLKTRQGGDRREIGYIDLTVKQSSSSMPSHNLKESKTSSKPDASLNSLPVRFIGKRKFQSTCPKEVEEGEANLFIGTF